MTTTDGSSPPSSTGAEAGATIRGAVAILLWAALASLTALTPEVPPFQQTALAFAEATLVGLAYTLASGARLATLARVPTVSWLLGVYGLLGYHVCYFFALKAAPTAEANLVNYLWPLLIVLLSALLPARLGGRRLAWWHVAGAALGLAGTALLLADRGPTPGLTGVTAGHVAALAAAVIWASYSVASRLLATVPSSAVTASCAATAIGALLCHLAFEETRWPSSPLGWAALVTQGLGPVGLAFYLWDDGMKRGDIRLLGVASYATPLLSTLLLAALGLVAASSSLWVAAALITAGAALAGREVWSGRRHRT